MRVILDIQIILSGYVEQAMAYPEDWILVGLEPGHPLPVIARLMREFPRNKWPKCHLTRPES